MYLRIRTAACDTVSSSIPRLSATENLIWKHPVVFLRSSTNFLLLSPRGLLQQRRRGLAGTRTRYSGWANLYQAVELCILAYLLPVFTFRDWELRLHCPLGVCWGCVEWSRFEVRGPTHAVNAESLISSGHDGDCNQQPAQVNMYKHTYRTIEKSGWGNNRFLLSI